jgi:hypothetical protein
MDSAEIAMYSSKAMQKVVDDSEVPDGERRAGMAGLVGLAFGKGMVETRVYAAGS